MANHITTIIKFDKKHQKEVTERVRGIKKLDDGSVREFDFERLIPIPKHIFQGNLGREDEEKHGKNNCWYQWSNFNWQTKWNAYQVVVKEGSIQFDSAWSMPYPVIRELSVEFPEIEFEVLTADEDIGSRCFHFKIKNLERTDVELFDWNTDKEKAYRFACFVKDMDYDEYMKDIEEETE